MNKHSLEVTCKTIARGQRESARVAMNPITKYTEAVERAAALYHDTGCGTNADPADGFGYCTCDYEAKMTAIHQATLILIQDLCGEVEIQSSGTNHYPDAKARNQLRGEILSKAKGLK